MSSQQRYEIAKETIESFKSDNRLSDIEILLTEEKIQYLQI